MVGGSKVSATSSDEARGVDRQFRQIDPPFAARARDDHRAGREANPRLLAHVRQSQDRGAHRPRGQDRRVAGDEGLARGGGLAAIGRHVGVRRDEVEQRDRRAERVGADLRDDGVGALPDVDRALEQREPSVGLQAEPHRRRIGERGVAAAVPHAGDADAAPQRPCGGGVESSGGRERFAPARAQRLEARLETHAVGEDLAGDRGVARLQRIEDAKLEPVEAEPFGEFVEQLLLCERGLRHAEPAKGAGGNEMGVHRASDGAIVRHAIGARGMHRHAIGDGRTPGGVGAGVEVGREIHRRQPPVARRAHFRADAGGMALGRRHDRFGARIDHPDRAIEPPRGERDERLDRQVQLRAESAADRGRDDAHLRRRDAENLRDVVAIHVGRLRAGLDFDAIADASRKAGFRLDIGVLDEAGLERALDDEI